jgi:hypothetical protein
MRTTTREEKEGERREKKPNLKPRPQSRLLVLELSNSRSQFQNLSFISASDGFFFLKFYT